MNKFENFDELLKVLNQIIHDNETKIEMFDYRYEEYVPIDSIEYDATENIIYVK